MLCEPPTYVVIVIGQIITTKSKVVWMEEGLKLGKTEFSEFSPKLCFSPNLSYVS